MSVSLPKLNETTSRRNFLKISVLSGTAFLLEMRGSTVAFGQTTGAESTWAPSPWISLDETGVVRIMVARSEMGQGVRTSLPMIVADQMGADWTKVRVENASPGPDFTEMRTSGSGSVEGAWERLPQAGALARVMLIQAAAVGWNVPANDCRAERGEVIHGPTGRRIAYGKLLDRLSSVEVPAAPSLLPWQLVGQPAKRLDGPDIVTGKARYGIDLKIPGMLYASVERRPSFLSELESFEPAAALEVTGVKQVVPITAGVAVVANSTWAAQKGREALEVSWKTGTETPFDSRTHEKRLVDATREAGLEAFSQGNVESALTGAAKRLDAVYEYAFQVHAPMEPMNCIAHVHDGECDIWTGTQAANQVQAAIAGQLGISPDRVHIHIPLLGGGFGRRLGLDFVREAVELSQKIGAPVQILWTRADDMKHGFFQPPSAHRMAAAIDANGHPLAWKHVMAGSPLTALRKPDLADPDLARDLMWGGYDNPYNVPTMHVAHVLVETPVPTGPWRAVHYPPGLLARECFLDEIAHAGGVDPVRLRIMLLDGKTGMGDMGRLVRVIETAAEKSGWGKPLPKGHGLGMAANIYHMATTMAQVAEVSVGDDGKVKVHRVTCVVDCGRVINPLGLHGQIESAILWGLSACLFGEITFTGGRADQANFADYPVARIADTPEIRIEAVESDLPPMGIGEQPVAPVAAAVLNGIFAATGKRIRRSPARPEDLTRATSG